MKKIILLVVVLLVLGGGGAGGWWFFGRGEANAETPEGKAAADAGHAGSDKGEATTEEAAAEEEGGGEHGSGPIYIALPQMIVPVVNDNRISQMLVLTIALEVAHAEDQESLKSQEPKLRDAAFRSLYGAADRSLLSDGAVVDVEAVKTRILASLDKAMGKGKIKSVLVQSLSQKSM